MVTLNTLNTLIDDVILTIRNNNISASEHINRTQIEQWITYYRARLIKEELEQNKNIDNSFVQYLEGIYLNEDVQDDNDELLKRCRYIADIKIPKTIRTSNSNGILSITDSLGNEIQQMSVVRTARQKYRKYTCNDYTAYLRGDKLYIEGPGDLEYININLIPENPSDVDDCDFADKPYPIPSSKIWLLKQMIFQNEFNIMLKMPSDDKNNSKDDLQNIIKNE